MTSTGKYYEGLSISGLDAVFDSFRDGTATITSRAGWKWTDTIHEIGMRFSDLGHQDLELRAERLADLHAAKLLAGSRSSPA